MDKRQLSLLGAGVALAVAAFAASAVHRSLQARERAAAPSAARVERSEAEDPEAAPEPAPPPADPRAIVRREQVGGLELRVDAQNEGKLVAPDGRMVALGKGFLGARVVPGVQLFGGEVVELAGKTCRDPCNPLFILVASPGGKPRTVLEAHGILHLNDLDGDGVPEALVDHLVRHSAEIVTLPYALEKERFVPAYGRFPDGVDRQLEGLSRSAERLCEGAPEGACAETVRALLALHRFALRDDLAALVSGLKVESPIKAWARDPGLLRDLEHEMKTVAR